LSKCIAALELHDIHVYPLNVVFTDHINGPDITLGRM